MSGLQQGKWRGPYEQLSLWDDCSSEPFVASSIPESPTGEVQLLEKILERDNLRRALRQVRRNRGAPGVDGMTVRELGRHLFPGPLPPDQPNRGVRTRTLRGVGGGALRGVLPIPIRKLL